MSKNRLSPYLISFILLVLLQCVACSPVKKQNDKLQIVTTIYPYEILVRQLVGEKGTVESFIPPNASPHTYSPNPGEMKLLENADLIISNGMGLEVNLDNFLKNLKERHISADLFVTDMISQELSDHDSTSPHSWEQDHQHSLNPHFWLDPILLISISQGLTKKIIELDPENNRYYESRLKELHNDLAHLDTTILEEREVLGSLDVINFHDSFHYFNRRYDINSVGIIFKSPGREPTPRELVDMGELITKNQVKVIFLEPQLNSKAAKIIAGEHHLEIEILDPIGSYFRAETISELLLLNWKLIHPYFTDL